MSYIQEITFDVWWIWSRLVCICGCTCFS